MNGSTKSNASLAFIIGCKFVVSKATFPNPSALGKHRFPMGLFHFFGRNGGKILRGATYAVQFMCFAHVFNQYVAEATFVSMPMCVDSVV